MKNKHVQVCANGKLQKCNIFVYRLYRKYCILLSLIGYYSVDILLLPTYTKKKETKNNSSIASSYSSTSKMQ